MASIVLLAVGCGAALFVLASSLMHRANVEEAADEEQLPTGSGEDIQQRAIACVAEQFGLSEREAQVVDGLSRGYTVKRVAEELFLSQSTVQGYSKSAYRKLDVHKKQEVIDLVDSEKQQLNAS